MNIVFATERLILRTFTHDDSQLLVDLNSNLEVLKFLHELPVNKEKAQEVLQEIILPNYTITAARRCI